MRWTCRAGPPDPLVTNNSWESVNAVSAGMVVGLVKVDVIEGVSLSGFGLHLPNPRRWENGDGAGNPVQANSSDGDAG